MTKCPELLPALQLQHSWNNTPCAANDTVVKENAWKHGRAERSSICGAKRIMCGDSSVYGPFHCSLGWRSFKTWIGIDRSITPTRPPTPSHQTARSFFHTHLFHWSSDYREAEATYGCCMLLHLPLGRSSWTASAAPPQTVRSTVRSLYWLPISYV